MPNDWIWLFWEFWRLKALKPNKLIFNVAIWGPIASNQKIFEDMEITGSLYLHHFDSHLHDYGSSLLLSCLSFSMPLLGTVEGGVKNSDGKLLGTSSLILDSEITLVWESLQNRG